VSAPESGRKVARGEAKGGKRWLALYAADDGYHYRMNDGSGWLAANDDADALDRMIAPWGPNTGPVTVLLSDFPSTRRVV
jgi:hypothetical protein